jgi:hypothetical protein
MAAKNTGDDDKINTFLTPVLIGHYYINDQ